MLFVDFDGVLHRSNGPWFERLPLLVDWLAKNLHVRLVVSSSHREGTGLSQLRNALPAPRQPCLIGQTPLHQNGTEAKSSLAVDTPYFYFQAGADALLQNLTDMDGSKPRAEEYLKALNATVSGAGASGSKARALVQAFHSLLMSYDIAPTISLEGLEEADKSRVKANIIWDHELRLIRSWLDTAQPSALIDATRCAFAIASSPNAPVRIGEVMNARLNGIDIQHDAIRIDLAPGLADTPLKSSESRRSLLITDLVARAAIEKWVKRRRLEEQRAQQTDGTGSEGSSVRTSAYLFGDVENPRRLKDGGAIVRLLNQLLKAATGDPEVSFHTLRHTIASAATNRSLSGDIQEINPIDVDAATMGHKSGTTQLVSYSHLSCAVIRSLVDQDFLRHGHLSSIHVEYWTHGDVKAATYRQTLFRMRAKDPDFSEEDLALATVKSTCARREVPLAHAGMNLVAAVSPVKQNLVDQLAFDQVLGCLIDLSNGLGVQQVALRQRMEASQVDAALTHAGRIARLIVGERDHRVDARSYGLQVLQDPDGGRLGFSPSFKHLQREHWQILRGDICRSAQNQDLALAIRYWLSNARGEYLGLREDDGDLLGMLSFLGSSKLNSSLIHIHANGEIADGRVNEASLHAVTGACKDKIGNNLSIVHRRYRAGRPAMYLVIGTPPQTDGREMRQGAGFSMVGFHCLMWAAAVHQDLLKSA